MPLPLPPSAGGGGPDGAPSSPSSGRCGGPDAGMEAPAAAADPAQGVEPSFFSLRSMVDLVPLTLAPLQIPDDGGEQRRRVLLRARWRAAAWPVQRGSMAGRRQPTTTAQIHGGAAPTHCDGMDPRRGGPNLPRCRGSTAGRRLPPTQSTAAQIRWAWRPPRPFLSLRRCGGLELRRIQSTAVDRRRRRDLGSVRPGSKPVWAFFLFFVFPERFAAAGVLMWPPR